MKGQMDLFKKTDFCGDVRLNSGAHTHIYSSKKKKKKTLARRAPPAVFITRTWLWAFLRVSNVLSGTEQKRATSWLVAGAGRSDWAVTPTEPLSSRTPLFSPPVVHLLGATRSHWLTLASSLQLVTRSDNSSRFSAVDCDALFHRKSSKIWQHESTAVKKLQSVTEMAVKASLTRSSVHH